MNNPLIYVDPSGFTYTALDLYNDMIAGHYNHYDSSNGFDNYSDFSLTLEFEKYINWFNPPSAGSEYSFERIKWSRSSSKIYPYYWGDGWRHKDKPSSWILVIHPKSERDYETMEYAPAHTEAFDGIWGKIKYFLLGGIDGMGSYNLNGDFIGPAPITGGGPSSGIFKGSSINSLRAILNSWKNTNFSSLATSVRYHFSKQVINRGIEKSLSQYTDDALIFFKANHGLGREVLLKDGTIGIKITTPGGGPGGIFTNNGLIVTFWY